MTTPSATHITLMLFVACLAAVSSAVSAEALHSPGTDPYRNHPELHHATGYPVVVPLNLETQVMTLRMDTGVHDYLDLSKVHIGEINGDRFSLSGAEYTLRGSSTFLVTLTDLQISRVIALDGDNLRVYMDYGAAIKGDRSHAASRTTYGGITLSGTTDILPYVPPPPPPPIVLSVSPDKVYEGKGNTTITISGLPSETQVRVTVEESGLPTIPSHKLEDYKRGTYGAVWGLMLHEVKEMRLGLKYPNHNLLTTSPEGTLSFTVNIYELLGTPANQQNAHLLFVFEEYIDYKYVKIGDTRVDLEPRLMVGITKNTQGSVQEGSDISFDVVLNRPADEPVSVTVDVRQRSLSPDHNVATASHTANFAVGESSKTITHTTTNDDIAQDSSRVTLSVRQSESYVQPKSTPSFTLNNDGDTEGVLYSKDCVNAYTGDITIDLDEGGGLGSYCIKLTSDPVELALIEAYSLPREFVSSEQYEDYPTHDYGTKIIADTRAYGLTKVGCAEDENDRNYGREIGTVDGRKVHVCGDRFIGSFTSDNWDTWQRAGQYAAMQDIDGFDHTFTVRSSFIIPIPGEKCYAGCGGLPSVTFNIDDDDDLPQNVLFDKDVGSMTMLPNSTFTFGIKLKSDPGDLTHSIYVRTDDNRVVNVSGGSFAANGIRSTTFGTGNWDNYQYFTLTAGETGGSAEILIRSDDPHIPGLLRDPHKALPNSLNRDSRDSDGYNRYDYHYSFYVTVPVAQKSQQGFVPMQDDVMNTPPDLVPMQDVLNSPMEVNPYWPIPEWTSSIIVVSQQEEEEDGYGGETLELKADNPVFILASDASIAEDGGSTLINVTLDAPLQEGQKAKVTLKVQGCGKNLKHCSLSLESGDNVKLKGEGQKKSTLIFGKGAQQVVLRLTATPNDDETDRTAKITLGKIKNIGGASVTHGTSIAYVDIIDDDAPVDSLTATSVGSDYITVEWPPVDGASYYEVIATADLDGTKYHTTTETTFTLTGLAPGIEYSIIVLDDLYTMAGQSIDVKTVE